MDIYSILQLIGGIGLFLYGMKNLGSALQRMAGASLEKTLEKLTSSKFKGLLLGTAVTAVIQSSSATTIMLVGFVNAGIMKLSQAIPVLLGADIGTTITGQILRLGDLSSGGGASTIASLLKPSSFAPLLIGVGAFIMLFSKKAKPLNIASIMLGFGILFFGMTTMETALKPLSTSTSFQEAFTSFTNPVVGFLLGLLISMILQSSSASVGILQAMSVTGSITMAVAVPMIIGISIGKIFPIVIASIGTKKEAQQVTASQLIISTIGGLFSMALIYLVISPMGLINWSAVMTRGNIADINTVYNVLVCILFIPFCNVVANLAKKLLKSDSPSRMDEELAMLDDIFLKTPSIALEQCRKVMVSMSVAAQENLRMANELHREYDVHKVAKMEENEMFLDKSETVLNDYLVKVSAKSKDLPVSDRLLLTEIMHSVMDFERIGDHCIKISKVATFNNDSKISFSSTARTELDYIVNAVNEILELTSQSFTEDDRNIAQRVEPLRELIDDLKDNIRSSHINRLQNGKCTVQSGISLIEYLTSLERISAYCSNIALRVIEKNSKAEHFDIHDYARDLHHNSREYKNLYTQYVEKYLVPLNKIDQP